MNHNLQDFRGETNLYQGTVAQGSNLTPTCVKCCRNNLSAFRGASIICFKCGKKCHILREFHNNRKGNCNGDNRPQSSSTATKDSVSPGGATTRIGRRANHLYAITKLLE